MYTLWLEIPLFGTYLAGMSTHIYQKICSRLSIVALFIIAKKWKLLTNSRMSKYILCACVCVCVCVRARTHVLMLSHVWLCDPMDCMARQAPLPMEFSSQEYWSRLPFPSPGDLPDPRFEPMSLVSPALAGGFFTSWATGEANTYWSLHSVEYYTAPRTNNLHLFKIVWVNPTNYVDQKRVT